MFLRNLGALFHQLPELATPSSLQTLKINKWLCPRTSQFSFHCLLWIYQVFVSKTTHALACTSIVLVFMSVCPPVCLSACLFVLLPYLYYRFWFCSTLLLVYIVLMLSVWLWNCWGFVLWCYGFYLVGVWADVVFLKHTYILILNWILRFEDCYLILKL